MATKKYSLAIEKIDEVAKEFIAARPAYTLHIKECNQGKQKQIEIVLLLVDKFLIIYKAKMEL